MRSWWSKGKEDPAMTSWSRAGHLLLAGFAPVALAMGLPSCSSATADANQGSPDSGVSDDGSPTAPDSGAPPVAVPLTGCVSIGYSAPVTIGGQTFELGLDTGSADLGVALNSCADCDVSPEYAAPDGSCSGTTSSDYGSGSLSGGSWSAAICSASVQVGAQEPAVTISVAGITTQSQFFTNYNCAGTYSEGILGLGPLDLDTIGSAKTDEYFPALVQQGVPDMVALLLCSTKGMLWFGGYDETAASGPPQYTPMTTSSAWTVNLLSIGLGAQSLGGADGRSMIDTGTWGFYMPSAAFSALVDAVTSDPGATVAFGPGKLDANFFSNAFGGYGCLAPVGGQSQSQIDAELPPMTLTLPGLSGDSFTLTLPATQSYLAPFPVKGAIEYCPGIADNSVIGNVTILGGTVLQAYITILDEGHRQVGFAPQSFCR
jgi:aspergillopepsin I